MNSIIPTESCQYEPEFNEETGEYYDECPYPPYTRNAIRYDCKCKAGSGFMGRQAFKNHIKNKTHQLYLKDYNENRKEVNDLKKENIKLRGNNERLELKLRQIAVATNKKLETLIEDKDREIKELKKRIYEFDNLDIDQILEEFEDYLKN
jgi:predicted transcriptional regulator